MYINILVRIVLIATLRSSMLILIRGNNYSRLIVDDTSRSYFANNRSSFLKTLRIDMPVGYTFQNTQTVFMPDLPKKIKDYTFSDKYPK